MGELLRYLVDCIRIEEIKRGQSSILKLFKLPETINPKKVDEETKVKIKEYGRQVKHTFLDSLFGGQLVSTVRCEECKNASQVYESFLDLSLPVMEEKPQRPNLVFIGKKKDSLVVAGDAGGGGVSSAASGMGLDFSEKPVSKYQDKKSKRLQKKEAKKKSKSQKWTSHDTQGGAGVPEKNEMEDKPTTPDCDNPVVSDDNNKIPPGKPDADHKIESGIIDSISIGVDHTGDGSLCTSTHVQKSSCMDLQNIDEKPPISAQEKSEMFEVECEKDDMVEVGNRDTADSSQEGSKDGLDGDPADLDSSSHDPSDADIEDNLETDMSRLDVSTIDNSVETSVKSDMNPVKPIAESTKLSFESCNVPSIDNSMAEKSVTCVNGVKPNSSSKSISKSCVGCEESNDSGFKDLVNGFDSLVINDSNKANVHKGIPSHLQEDSTDGLRKHLNSNNDPSLPETNGNDKMISVNAEPNSFSAGDKHKTTVLPDCDLKQKSSEVKDKCVVQKKSRRHISREARSYSMSTLAPRYHPAPRECSIMSCLNQFTAAELLTGSNKVSCKECTKAKRKNSLPKAQVNGDKKTKDTVYSNSNKQYLIFRPPAVLTLHLKRFEQTGLTSRKVNRHVEFPLLLDLAPYCSSLSVGVCAGQSRVLYGLYGVVEHSGRLSGGHYTAYIKVRPGLSPQGQFLHSNPPSASDLLNM